MNSHIDIKTKKDNYDILIENGDIVIGDNTIEHIRAIILSSEGDFKRFPFIGVNLQQFKNTVNNDYEIKQVVKKQLDMLGYDIVKSVDVFTDSDNKRQLKIILKTGEKISKEI